MKRTIATLMVFAMVGSLMFMGFAGTAAAQNDEIEVGTEIDAGGGDGGDALHEGHDVDVETGPAVVDQNADATNTNSQEATSVNADESEHNKASSSDSQAQFQDVEQENDQTQVGFADSSANVDVSGDAEGGDGGDGGDSNVTNDVDNSEDNSDNSDNSVTNDLEEINTLLENLLNGLLTT